jgi:anti-sigma-K factor RskA
MNREEIAELAAGYALGALDPDDRARFDALLASGDAEATAALRDFEGAVTGLARETTIQSPPPAVKAALMARIDAQGRSLEAVETTLASVRPSPSGRSAWTLVLSGAMAAGIAAIAVGWIVSTAYDHRVTQLAQETATLKQELDRQQTLIALLQDPATQLVALGGLEAAPGAKARMLWQPTAGGLLVTQGLPAAPEGKAYELWAIAGKNAPVPAGVFTVDAKGVGSLRVAPLRVEGTVDTFAVTLEPAAGVAAPTGAMYLAGKL